ncbi:MAG: response regulator transcription factor [Cytophagaceae bacterium]
MKLLIVEDEETYLMATSKFLEKKGFLVETATDFDEALDKITMYEYDCIILDINLPGGNGIDLLKELKKSHPDAGVIIASSKDKVEEKIEGLVAGSDDYITKPYDFNELEARITAIIRRRSFKGETLITFKEIKINPDERDVQVNGKHIELTQTEYELLIYFITNKNKAIKKENIAEKIWGDEMDQADSFNFIYSHIKNLRKKLIDAGADDYIHTVYGIGYKWYAE